LNIEIENLKFAELSEKFPYAGDFFDVNGLPEPDRNCTIMDYISSMPYVLIEDMGVDKNGLLKSFKSFLHRMGDIRSGCNYFADSITIIGGTDKNGEKENPALKIKKGDIVSIVGPTGSGKSRLLADIEWMAQIDTPTNRKILINDKTPPKNWRFSVEHKLVAQLSQNMNFVMDISVCDFILLHARSRLIKNAEEKAKEIIFHANALSGEAFDLSTPLTSLSGGQSRALMVADTAFLSTSPIVLIDEIENAGIDRRLALDLLVGQDKIVLIATHDPLLALMGNRRIVIKNGGIHKVIETSPEEKARLKYLEELDKSFLKYRELLRNGEMLI